MKEEGYMVKKAMQYDFEVVREDIEVLFSLYGYDLFLEEEDEIILSLFERTFGYWLPLQIFNMVIRE